MTVVNQIIKKVKALSCAAKSVKALGKQAVAWCPHSIPTILLPFSPRIWSIQPDQLRNNTALCVEHICMNVYILSNAQNRQRRRDILGWPPLLSNLCLLLVYSLNLSRKVIFFKNGDEETLTWLTFKANICKEGKKRDQFLPLLAGENNCCLDYKKKRRKVKSQTCMMHGERYIPIYIYIWSLTVIGSGYTVEVVRTSLAVSAS